MSQVCSIIVTLRSTQGALHYTTSPSIDWLLHTEMKKDGKGSIGSVWWDVGARDVFELNFQHVLHTSSCLKPASWLPKTRSCPKRSDLGRTSDELCRCRYLSVLFHHMCLSLRRRSLKERRTGIPGYHSDSATDPNPSYRF